MMNRPRLKLISAILLLAVSPAVAQDVPTAKSSLPRIRAARDQRTFETENGQPFVPLGVTYYRPGTGWAPQVWRQFDAAATRRDFARMKELGVNCVRVFLSYGTFAQEPGKLLPEGLAKFDQFLEIAEETGIYVHPTGPDHWEGVPDWAKGDRIANESFLRGVESFWKLFATRYRGRSVIFAYDLRNEPEVRWDTPELRQRWNTWLRAEYGSVEEWAAAWAVKPDSVEWGKAAPPATQDDPGNKALLDYQRFREFVADEWTRRQAVVIKEMDPLALVTVGLIQWSVPSLLPGVSHYAAFRPERQARFLDFLEVHFYPLNKGAYEYGGPEEESRNLAYLESVVREVAKPGKPVVIAEFGWYGGGKPTFDNGRHPEATEEQQARWCRRVVETTAGLAVGWLNWGFYDHPEARDVSQFTGLLAVDGRWKAWGRDFNELARRYKNQFVPALQLGSRPELNWNLCVTSAAAGHQFREEYFRAFRAER